jgi:hypothetical protein
MNERNEPVSSSQRIARAGRRRPKYRKQIAHVNLGFPLLGFLFPAGTEIATLFY